MSFFVRVEHEISMVNCAREGLREKKTVAVLYALTLVAVVAGGCVVHSSGWCVGDTGTRARGTNRRVG